MPMLSRVFQENIMAKNGYIKNNGLVEKINPGNFIKLQKPSP
jgi:hypothetical protein